LICGSAQARTRSSLFEKATEAARKAITLDDNNSDAHCVLCFISLARREHEKAIAEAKRAIALNPNNADAYNILGLALFYSSRYVESIGFLKKRFGSTLSLEAFI